ncbi:MAG: CoA-binding protein [Flavobacteriales bacterium]|nr:CoA-binding protein [Flavobacteriales bacterium]
MSDTLVLGASPNPSRYSHLAVLRLRAAGHGVIAIGRREGQIADIAIRTTLPDDIHVDTVTLYLSPANQRMWVDAVMALRPRRVIFNPGAEDPDFAEQLRSIGIEALDACTLVMLSTGAY